MLFSDEFGRGLELEIMMEEWKNVRSLIRFRIGLARKGKIIGERKNGGCNGLE